MGILGIVIDDLSAEPSIGLLPNCIIKLGLTQYTMRNFGLLPKYP